MNKMTDQDTWYPATWRDWIIPGLVMSVGYVVISSLFIWWWLG